MGKTRTDGERATTAVLVVEDDAETRQALSMALEDDGYTVVEAPDGMTAIERLLANSRRYVVLLDWWMPGLDGIQVLQALAGTPLVRRHAYILLTAAHDLPRLEEANLPAEMEVAIMRKPFDLQRLFNVVARAVQRLANGWNHAPAQ